MQPMVKKWGSACKSTNIQLFLLPSRSTRIPTRKETQDKPEGTNSQHSPNFPATNNSSWSTINSNEVNFLRHCNRKLLDMDQMFSSKQEVKYIKLHWLNMLDPTCKVKFTVFPKLSF